MSGDRLAHRFGWQSLKYFARTRNRLQILNALCESPQPPATLEETLGMPRSTLRRLATDLEEEGWLYSTPSKVLHPTPPAQLLVDTLTETLSTLDVITRLAIHLTNLPATVAHDDLTAADVDDVRANLGQVQVTLPTPTNPYAPTHRFADRLVKTNSLQLVVPAVHPLWGSAIEQHANDSNSCELITTRPVLRTVATKYSEIIDSVRHEDTVNVYLTADVPEYGIALLDDVVVVAGYDSDRRLRSLLEVSRDCAAVESWATETYVTQRDGATEMARDELDSLLDELSKGEDKQEYGHDELW